MSNVVYVDFRASSVDPESRAPCFVEDENGVDLVALFNQIRAHEAQRVELAKAIDSLGGTAETSA